MPDNVGLGGMDPSEDPTAGEGELSNKNETEVPIGEPTEPEGRSPRMWRCGACGEMGEFTGTLPSTCPSCDAAKEELYYWEED